MHENNSGVSIIAMVAGYINDVLFAVIRSLMNLNATVIVLLRSSNDIRIIRKLVAEIKSGKLVTILIDFPDNEHVSMLTNVIVEQYGQLNIVVEIFDDPLVYRSLYMTESGDWRQTIEDNLASYFIAGKTCIEAMKKKQKKQKKQEGMFLVISNVADSGNLNSPLRNALTVKKMEMTKLFYEEVKRSGVRVYHLLTGHSQIQYLFNGPGHSKTSRELTVGDFAIRLFKGEVRYPERLFQSLPGFDYHSIWNTN
ncbi:MAG TPA: SDR family NAD(P)-dependent oxidoreductase [Flavitalea sp.]|nr:SDR family NAD(P)-dependent oxidoreductase [Flavitalea sp.]